MFLEQSQSGQVVCAVFTVFTEDPSSLGDAFVIFLMVWVGYVPSVCA
jgi:hypothetical protein